MPEQDPPRTSRSRPGRWPVTIWPSSACSDAGESRPVSTWRRQRAEPARLRSPPVVDHHLVHHVEQVEFHRADGAVGDDEGARPDRGGAQQRRGFRSAATPRPGCPRRRRPPPRCPVTGREALVTAGELPRERSRDSGRRLVTRISSRSNSSSSSTTFQNAVPARPTWPSLHPRVRPGQVAGTYGAVIAPVRQAVIKVASMDRQRNARAGVVQRQQPELAGQPGGVVGHEVRRPP